MFKISGIAAIIGLLLPTSLLAQTIQGEVKNDNGKSIAGATVRVEGTGAATTTDKNGRFIFHDLASGKNEIHISAEGFAHLHQDIILSDDKTDPLTLVLTRSPIEVIDIVATPIHMSVMESAAPVSVLAGDALRRQQASTLGDSLEKLPGVQSNFHGNVASTPIIRGLSGPRVMIAQNGLDASDVSRVGPDHSVASEASTAQQIEVLRGPATLFYGSGAVGGVINVVDGRVPTDSTTRGEWLLENNSADDRKLASFNLTTGTDSFGFYADGYWRESNDYEVPVEAELETEEEHAEHDHDHDSGDFTVENSAEKSNGFTLGTSYLFDQGYVGVAVEQFNREYGVPGHSHGDESENVYADLEQTRVQLLGEFNIDNDWVKQVKFASGFTDYEHAEIEAGQIGTIFENQTQEVKVDIIQSPFYDWNGGISFHFKDSDVSAEGEEAFTPPSEAQTIALALMQEKHFGDVLLQFGARIEHVKITADNVLLPSLDAHSHDESEEEDAHDHDHDHDDETTSSTQVFAVEHKFTPVSLSAGLVWAFTPGYNLGLSISRSERAPSASELLSFGPHIGTGSYEIGSLFALNEDNTSLGLSNEVIDLETANNIDLTFRKTQGNVAFVLNAFYNQIDNYYYQTFTGLYAESGHDHGDDGHDHDEEETELPVYLFQTDDVVLHGFEAQVAWQVNDTFKATAFSDYVRAKVKDGDDLPRTPPLRFGTQFEYQNEQISAHLDITRYQDQNNTSINETSTDGYTLVDASVSYDLEVLNHDIALYLKGTNLTDTEARVHTSFIKDIAPRPGRSFAIGIRGYF
ncbi:TonB-dependent receptor [Colwellia sp. 4_MG-2023]|uniref:TonB-dependent receptor n=1 Tax=unclassified Colwellia TaxID=196834 RepID=UPI0026E1ACCC|nr:MULTISPECIES: TonB-dependent receptor [unclassified Colwellia]MDO6486143.1 TonB-dependent receptor [Colwellia sp. 6_MG-2023]MDO6505897.1 TonB-dependent receptor [Colwellia sp. 5_MG-2023]MDO6554578.1 TonB-dependent receptor [Colwellia sp. 4_MG-2023]